MNTFTAVVIGLLAYLFFLSGQSFLTLLSLSVLVLYVVATKEGGSGNNRAGSAYSPQPNSEKAVDTKKVDEFAGRTGDLVNVLGTLLGKFAVWAFAGEKKEEKKAKFNPKLEFKDGEHKVVYEKKD